MGRIERKGRKTKLHGVAGDIEFFTIGDKTYFKSYAKTHKKSKSRKAVTGRNNFKSVVKLAKIIIQIPELKEIWNQSSLEGRNAYQKIIKYNMPLAYDGNLTIKNYYTVKGQTLVVPEFSFNEDSLNIVFDLYGRLKPPLKLHLVYYFYNHKSAVGFVYGLKYDTINITPDIADKIRKKGESKYSIKNKLEKYEIDQLSEYKDVVVLLAVTGTPLIANRKYWTNTVGFDIPLI